LRTVLRELGLTSDQVWSLLKSDDDWSAALEAAVTAIRRGTSNRGRMPGTPGCVCMDCREHQRQRMAKNRR
jgi:hypothetical protein